MTTAQEIVSDGLALILVDEADITLEANELAIGVRFLNDWCAQQHAEGVNFGYKPVSNPSDTITSPADVNLPLKQVVAVLLAPVFGMPVPVDVRIEATIAKRGLINRFYEIESSTLPDTLPLGSGNDSWTSGNYFDPFYGIAVPEAALRLEASTTVAITTINTPVQVIGPWKIERDVNTKSTTAGAITFELYGPYLASFEAALTVTAAAGDQFTFYFAKNGAILEQSRLPFEADKTQPILVKWVGTLRDKDVVTLVVENNSDTTDLTITAASLRIT